MYEILIAKIYVAIFETVTSEIGLKHVYKLFSQGLMLEGD